jgi:hypothetical protein
MNQEGSKHPAVSGQRKRKKEIKGKTDKREKEERSVVMVLPLSFYLLISIYPYPSFIPGVHS